MSNLTFIKSNKITFLSPQSVTGDIQLRRSTRRRRPPGPWWMQTVESIFDLEPRRLSSEFSSVGASPVATFDPNDSPGDISTYSPLEVEPQTEPLSIRIVDDDSSEDEVQVVSDSRFSPTTPNRPDADDNCEFFQDPQLSPKNESLSPMESHVEIQKESDLETPPFKQEHRHEQSSTVDAILPQPSAPRKAKRYARRAMEDIEPVRSILFDDTKQTKSVSAKDRIGTIPRDSGPVHHSPPDFLDADVEDDGNFLVAVQSKLKYVSVPSPAGFVKVAFGLYSNSMLAGDIRIAPRKSTGVRRALRADEFYYISRGIVQLDIGIRRLSLSEGDYFAIMHHTSFEIRNPGMKEVIIVCFTNVHG